MKVIMADKKRISKLSQVFAESMYQDPMYQYIFSDWELNQRYFKTFWHGILDYTFKFGYVITTDDYSGALCLLPPKHTDFSFIDLFRTGFKIPLKILRFPIKQAKITFDILMKLGVFQSSLIQEPHWYLMSIGVIPEEQGKGKGTNLLYEAIRIAGQDNKPIYLETETDKNVRLYQKFGFNIVKDTTLSKYNLRYYLMIRSSQKH